MNKFVSLMKRENGQSLILVALLLVIVLGVAAIVVDIGRLTLSKSELQNAADASALAGAQELPDNPDQARFIAESYKNTNGKSDDNTTVSIGTDNKSITVTLNRTVPMSLARVLGINASTISVDATVKIGVAASVPWIVPFVIPRPEAFNFDETYVMRMYGNGAYLDYPGTGFPSGYSYPSDYKSDPVYKNYPLTNRYKFQFDYMNVYIKKNTNFYNYIDWLENGYHETFSINEKMFYYAPSSGGKESVDAFARRASRDPNNDYANAKLGDGRVMLIPIVDSILKRNTNSNGTVPVKIIGFVGFFIEEVHKNSYGQSFWFEGRFLENFNIGTGEVTFDTNADFGLRVQKLVD